MATSCDLYLEVEMNNCSLLFHILNAVRYIHLAAFQALYSGLSYKKIHSILLFLSFVISFMGYQISFLNTPAE